MTGGIDSGGGELEPIPLTFSSAEQYVAVLEPLLHEEARAGVQVRWECEEVSGGVEDVEEGSAGGWFGGGKGSCAGGRGRLCMSVCPCAITSSLSFRLPGRKRVTRASIGPLT